MVEMAMKGGDTRVNGSLNLYQSIIKYHRYYHYVIEMNIYDYTC